MDSADFDQRNWHEWIELFVNDYPATVNAVHQYKDMVVNDLGITPTPGPSAPT